MTVGATSQKSLSLPHPRESIGHPDASSCRREDGIRKTAHNVEGVVELNGNIKKRALYLTLVATDPKLTVRDDESIRNLECAPREFGLDCATLIRCGYRCLRHNGNEVDEVLEAS